MSLLTNRSKRKDPPAKKGDTMTNKDPNPTRAAARTATEETEENFRKSNLVPEVDAQGNRTGFYVKYKPEEKKTVIKTNPSPKGKQPVSVMQLDQSKKTGQKQVGTRYWDEDSKQWKMSMPKS